MATKVASEIHKIDCPIADVYSLLSDFNRIGALVNMAKQMGAANVKDERMDKLKEFVQDVRFTEDVCYITVKQLGEIAIMMVEKEYPKLVKLEGCIPFEFNIWIQLLEKGPYDTRMKITFQGELNMMMKMLLKGKLQKGIDQLAEGMSKIPYSMLRV